MDVADILYKICNKCKIVKSIDLFTYRTDRGYHMSQCKDCMRIYKRLNYSQNINHYREYKKLWKNKVGTDIISKNNYKHVLNWIKNNPEKVKASQRKIYKKYMDNLSNTYLKDLISDCGRSGLKPHEIPQEIIELKRKQLILTRQIRNHEKNKNSNDQ